MSSMKPLLIFVLSVLLLAAAPAARPLGEVPADEPTHPAAIPLWANGAPGSEGRKDEKEVVMYHTGANYSYTQTSNIHNPSITAYVPAKEKATGAAVIIAPGGGHQYLAIDHEGYNVAQYFADHGIAGFVLKYRLARGSPGANYSVEKESLADAQRALRLVRSRAGEWNLNKNAVGVMGFSAGGEVVALASMKYDAGVAGSADVVERESSKPSFQALMYPGNSRGVVPDKNSPPAFLACDADDRADISEGLPAVYLAFHKAGVPAELHIYGSGGHGFGLAVYKPKMLAAGWPAAFEGWLGDRGFLKK